jgi:hypothetical protein
VFTGLAIFVLVVGVNVVVFPGEVAEVGVVF